MVRLRLKNETPLPSMLTCVALAACGARTLANPESQAASPPAAIPPALQAETIASTVDPLIRSALAEEGIPGAAFVFVQGDRVVYAQGYGTADRERGAPVDVERTVWPVASITKLFTGVAARNSSIAVRSSSTGISIGLCARSRCPPRVIRR